MCCVEPSLQRSLDLFARASTAGRTVGLGRMAKAAAGKRAGQSARVRPPARGAVTPDVAEPHPPSPIHPPSRALRSLRHHVPNPPALSGLSVASSCSTPDSVGGVPAVNQTASCYRLGTHAAWGRCADRGGVAPTARASCSPSRSLLSLSLSLSLPLSSLSSRDSGVQAAGC